MRSKERAWPVVISSYAAYDIMKIIYGERALSEIQKRDKNNENSNT